MQVYVCFTLLCLLSSIFVCLVNNSREKIKTIDSNNVVFQTQNKFVRWLRDVRHDNGHTEENVDPDGSQSEQNQDGNQLEQSVDQNNSPLEQNVDQDDSRLEENVETSTKSLISNDDMLLTTKKYMPFHSWLTRIKFPTTRNTFVAETTTDLQLENNSTSEPMIIEEMSYESTAALEEVDYCDVDDPTTKKTWANSLFLHTIIPIALIVLILIIIIVVCFTLKCCQKTIVDKMVNKTKSKKRNKKKRKKSFSESSSSFSSESYD